MKLNTGTVFSLREEFGAVGKIGAPAIGADLAFADQFFQGVSHGFGFINRKTVIVELIQVNVIGIESAQRFFAGFANACRGCIGTEQFTRLLIEHGVEFRRDHDFLAPACKCAPKNFFAVARAVQIGGIKKVDTQLHGTMNSAYGFVIIHFAPAVRRALFPDRPADRPASHAEGANFNTRTAKFSCESHFFSILKLCVPSRDGVTTPPLLFNLCEFFFDLLKRFLRNKVGVVRGNLFEGMAASHAHIFHEQKTANMF